MGRAILVPADLAQHAFEKSHVFHGQGRWSMADCREPGCRWWMKAFGPTCEGSVGPAARKPPVDAGYKQCAVCYLKKRPNAFPDGGTICRACRNANAR